MEFDHWHGENSRKEGISSHPIVESCLRDKCGGGNLLSGGLGVGVYLRIKLSETNTSFECSKEYLKSALEILWTRLRKESESCVDDGDNNESSHMSFLSNPFLGSRCLLVSLLSRLGRREEAYEVATSVLGKLSELYEKGTHKDCDRDCSILFGLGGALQVIWFLRKELRDKTLGRDLALTLSYTILLEGLQHHRDDGNDIESDNLTLRWKWNGWPYLGTGTGSVGILYALLGHTEDEWQELGDCLPDAKSFVKKTIENLANHRYEAPLDSDSFSGRGNLKHSLVDFEPDESSSVCDWTHGAPGYCLLLLKAFDVYGDERFFFHARDLADSVIWNRWQNQAHQNEKGRFGLAKGSPGIAYIFLAMTRVDWRDRNIWIHRAKEVATIAVSQEVTLSHDETADPKSLFNGIGGLASLLIDLEEVIPFNEMDDHQLPLSFSFPFFESCRADSNPRRLKYHTRPEDHFFRVHNHEIMKRKQIQSDICAHNTTTESPAMTRVARSSAETATTQALTLPTQATTMVWNNNESGIASGLDVSQLTEPLGIEVTPQRCSLKKQCSRTERCSRIAKSPMPPTIIEINESIPKIIFRPTCVKHSSPEPVNTPPKNKTRRRPPTTTSPFSCNDHTTESYKARARASMLYRIQAEKRYVRRRNSHSEYYSDADDCAFMTDSIKRIQRAEASWIQHFGTLEQRNSMRQSSLGSSSKNSANNRFRRAMGGFSCVSD